MTWPCCRRSGPVGARRMPVIELSRGTSSDTRVSLGKRLVLAAVCLLVSGCGGDGGGDEKPPPLPSACIAFTPSGSPAGNSVVAQVGAEACDTVEIELIFSDVADVFAVSFSVVFDPNVAVFREVSTTGSFLEADGATLEVLVGEMPGRVEIGITRLASTGLDASGPELLATLLVARASAGVGALAFEDTKVLGSETPPQEKPGVQWIGGILEVM